MLLGCLIQYTFNLIQSYFSLFITKIGYHRPVFLVKLPPASLLILMIGSTEPLDPLKQSNGIIKEYTVMAQIRDS